MDLVCPKCHGVMRQYDRAGVMIDQCTECRGIFLDRGELERLIDAETRWHGGRGSPPPAHSEYRYGYQHGGGYPSGGYPRRRKRSFLEDLFD
ncbi:MAG TPA: zf-TFIIB domain-containing protein [Actinopolymorphaceae bacterium]